MKKLITLSFAFLSFFGQAQTDSTAFEALNGTIVTKKYVDVPTGVGSNLLLNTNWTIEAWVFVPVSASGAQMFIVETYSFSATGGFLLRLNNFAIQAYQFESPSIYSTVNGSTTLTLGTWNHVAATMNESTNELTVYLNGVEDGTTSSAIETTNSNTNLYIGARGDDQQIHQPLIIDEVRIWNHAKSGAQLTAKMNDCLLGNESGLLAYYNFEETTTAVVEDVTGNGNTGTIVNFDATCLKDGVFDCTAFLDVDKTENENLIGVYPNPANSILTIQSDGAINSVLIFNVTGELVQSETSKSFSVENLPSGIYFLQYQIGNEIGTTRFVKQ